MSCFVARDSFLSYVVRFLNHSCHHNFRNVKFMTEFVGYLLQTLCVILPKFVNKNLDKSIKVLILLAFLKTSQK